MMDASDAYGTYCCKQCGNLAAFNDKERVDLGHIKQIAPMALSHRLRRDPLDDAGSGTRVERSVQKIIG